MSTGKSEGKLGPMGIEGPSRGGHSWAWVTEAGELLLRGPAGQLMGGCYLRSARQARETGVLLGTVAAGKCIKLGSM